MRDREPENVIAIGTTEALPPAAGGKARGLAAIALAGLPVPAAWVVLPGASEAELHDLSRALRQRGILSVAVRSSSPDEDGARTSFAGVHETELAVPLERLAGAVAAVAGSPTSQRAGAYRRQLGLPPGTGPCAVVVQEMVDAECAGIAFGRSGGEVVVEAVEGLGTVAVDGEATPETLVVRWNGESWIVSQRRPRRQGEALRVEDATLRRVRLDPARQGDDVLSAPTAAAIAAGTRRLEEALGRPADVEWAWRAGSAQFLQARPQTRPLEADLPPGQAWTRANVREVFPEVPSAFTRSALLPLVDRAQRQVLRRQGVPVAGAVPLLACVHGRPAFNEKVFAASDALGVSRGWARALLGGTGGESNGFTPIRWTIALRHPRLLLGSLSVATGAAGRARRYLRALRDTRSARWAVPARDCADPVIVERVTSAIGEDFGAGIATVLEVAAAMGAPLLQATSMLRAWESPASTIARLLAPEDASTSTRQLGALVSLAVAFRAWEGAAAFLSPVGAEHAHVPHWAAELPADLWAQVERWLAEYGHRGPHELDFASARFAEDPRLLARALVPLVAATEPPSGATERHERRRRERDETWSDLARDLGPVRRRRLAALVRKLSARMALREEVRSELAAHGLRIRLDLLELGRRLAARGRLEAPEQVFDLDLDGLDRASKDPSYDAIGAVRRERARLAAWRRVEVPNRFTSEEARDLPLRPAASGAGAAELRGTAVSPGQAEGRVCVVRSPADDRSMIPGSVLVAPATDPGWTPLLAQAIAVVVEVGGLLSHAATVAREYGIPSVSNVDGATDVLADGDVVRVDGTRGVVEIVERARSGGRSA